MYQNELTHYGVKGMKWGVRKKYDYKNDKVSIKTNEKEEVTNNEKRTIMTKKNITIGAAAVGATLAVMGYMYVSKKKKIPTFVKEINTKLIDKDSLSKVDTIINKNTKMQRISSKKFEDYVESGKSIYVSFDKKDNRLYKEVIPENIKRWGATNIISDDGSKAYSHSIKMNKDIKVASQYKMFEAYKKVFRTDEVKQYEYSNFMTGLSDRNNPNNKKFIDELTRMGYNAIFDENDMGWTKKPLILLNPKDDVDKVKSHRISKIERILNVILM